MMLFGAFQMLEHLVWRRFTTSVARWRWYVSRRFVVGDSNTGCATSGGGIGIVYTQEGSKELLVPLSKLERQIMNLTASTRGRQINGFTR